MRKYLYLSTVTEQQVVKRISYIFILMVVIAGMVPLTVMAQTDPQITHYMFTTASHNPAFIAKEDYLNATLLYRNQWTGFEGDGNPSTQLLNIHAPLLAIPGGMGLTVINDMYGVERSTYFNLGYSWHTKLGKGKLGMGLSAGAIQRSVDGTKLRAPDGSYEGGVVDHNDIYIPNTHQIGWAPDVSVGFYYLIKKFYAGVSSTRVIEGKTSLETQQGTTDIRYQRNYYFNAGYSLDISKKFSWEPSVQLKTDANQYQVDFNSIFLYNRNIYGGLAFRGYSSSSLDAMTVMLGVTVAKSFTIGYSYDASLSELNQHNFGSHEVMINYQMPMKDPSREGKIIYNPRFL